MLNTKYPLLFLFIFIYSFTTALYSQSFTQEQWEEDINFFASSIRETHPNPFKYISESSFQNQIDSLQGGISHMKDHEVIINMAGILAQINDGHTQLQFFNFFTGQFPLGFIACEDGIYVNKAPLALKGILGKRLIKIGEVSAESAFQKVSTITPHDNQQTLKNWVPSILTFPEVLEALNIISDIDRARFVFTDYSDREFILDLVPIPLEEKINWISKPSDENLPLHLTNLKVNYWYKYLEDEQTLYVQYNKVQDAKSESIAEYFARLSSLVDEVHPRIIILDIRHNGGGNDNLNSPVVAWVESSLPKVNGKLYVIIGRGTYSAAQKLVTKLEASTEVVFAGEPTGSSPNHFGDPKSYQLPNSNLTLKISSLYHNDAPGDDRRSLEPSILIPFTCEDYFGEVDLVLETILPKQKN
jgi:hypothetical protein